MTLTGSAHVKLFQGPMPDGPCPQEGREMQPPGARAPVAGSSSRSGFTTDGSPARVKSFTWRWWQTV